MLVLLPAYTISIFGIDNQGLHNLLSTYYQKLCLVRCKTSRSQAAGRFLAVLQVDDLTRKLITLPILNNYQIALGEYQKMIRTTYFACVFACVAHQCIPL